MENADKTTDAEATFVDTMNGIKALDKKRYDKMIEKMSNYAYFAYQEILLNPPSKNKNSSIKESLHIFGFCLLLTFRRGEGVVLV